MASLIASAAITPVKIALEIPKGVLFVAHDDIIMFEAEGAYTKVYLKGRKTDAYKKIAEIGVKYGWYNPWRLSDNAGTDEIWHFEYWGPI